jgi:hypothetical protein
MAEEAYSPGGSEEGKRERERGWGPYISFKDTPPMT